MAILRFGNVVRGGTVVAAMRIHQSVCVIGISTLALPSCAVSPTISSFTTIMILRSDRVKVLHPLNAIFYMIILYLFRHYYNIEYYYIVDSLTDP